MRNVPAAAGWGRCRTLGAFALALFFCFVLLVSIAPVASAGTVGVTARIQGAGSVSSSVGGPYFCSKTTNQDERVTVDCDRAAFGAVFSASVTLVPTAATFPSGQWSFVGWEGCDSVVGDACTVSSGSFSLDEKFPKAIFGDGSPPTVVSDGETFGDRSATVFFHSDEPANWTCRLDSGVSEGCGTNSTFPAGKTYSGLSEGSHSVSVQAFDPSGQASTTLQRTFTIVDTALTGGPAENARLNTRTATFNYTTVAGDTFECSVDFGAFQPCGNGKSGSNTVTVATDGLHNFRVRARTGGFVDPVPAARNWRVDTDPPETTLNALSGPAEGVLTLLTAATLQFTADEPGSFECRLDGGSFAACTSPRELTGLAPGAHTFEVRAVDAAGNVDGTPATRSWTIAQPDSDGDGYNALADCDDANASIHPGAAEVVGNGLDDNCDGINATSASTGGTGSTSTPGSAPAGGSDSGSGTAGGGGGGAASSDTVAPVIAMTLSKMPKLPKALKRGVLGSASSSEAATLRFDVLIAGKLAKKLKLSRTSALVVLATGGDRPIGTAGKLKLTAKFSRKAKKALARLRSVKVTVRLTATDGAGNSSVKTRTVTLKR